MTELGAPDPEGDQSRFGWAVVGIGRHARQYVIPALAHSRRGRLAALVSSNPDSALRFGERWGTPRVYEHYEDALHDPAVDGVFLATPNDAHLRQVLAAAAAGKHVLCEKPLATSAADAAAMITACRERRVVLGSGFHLRHNTVHRRARTLVREGRIGELQLVRASYAHRTAPLGFIQATPEQTSRGDDIPPVAAWRGDPDVTGGGAFVGTGSHALDIVRFLTGKEFVDVSVRADADAMHEHNLVVSAAMTDRTIATVHGGDLPFPINETVISGSLGSVVCRGSVGNIGKGTLTLVTAEGEENWSPEPHDVYTRECDAFVDAVRAGVEADASGVDGLRCQEIIEAIYASVERHQLTPVERALQTHEHAKE